MNLLQTLIGVTVVFVNMLAPAMTANVCTEVLPEETSVCGVKIGDLYCRSGDVYMFCRRDSQF
jgi:hypothetical protein